MNNNFIHKPKSSIPIGMFQENPFSIYHFEQPKIKELKDYQNIIEKLENSFIEKSQNYNFNNLGEVNNIIDEFKTNKDQIKTLLDLKDKEIDELKKKIAKQKKRNKEFKPEKSI